MGDWDAATYHRVSAPQQEWGREVLARLQLDGDETVLDAGCGSGRLTQELAARLPKGQAVAVDLSASMLQQAARHFDVATGRERLDLVRADLLALPFRHTFDVIFSTAAFHWVLDQPRLFAQLHEALKPGGRLHAQCGGGATLRRLHRRAAALMRDQRFAPFFQDWVEPWEFQGEATATRRLQRAGFKHVQAWLEPRPATLATAREFRTFVQSIVLRPHLAYLPTAASRKQFMDAIVRQAAGDDPAYTLDYVRLNLEAST